MDNTIISAELVVLIELAIYLADHDFLAASRQTNPDSKVYHFDNEDKEYRIRE